MKKNDEPPRIRNNLLPLNYCIVEAAKYVHSIYRPIVDLRMKLRDLILQRTFLKGGTKEDFLQLRSQIRQSAFIFVYTISINFC